MQTPQFLSQFQQIFRERERERQRQRQRQRDRQTDRDRQTEREDKNFIYENERKNFLYKNGVSLPHEPLELSVAALQFKYKQLKAKWISITCDARGGSGLKETAEQNVKLKGKESQVTNLILLYRYLNLSIGVLNNQTNIG